MMFSTAESRTRFFQNAIGGNIQLGAAFAHAASTSLGIWGSSRSLRWDCAKIMAEEMCAFAHAQHIRWPYNATAESRDTLAEKIDRNESFQRAFNAAQRGKVAEVENAVRSLGNNSEHLSKMDGSVSSEELSAIQSIHATLYKQVIGPIRKACRTPATAEVDPDAECGDQYGQTGEDGECQHP